MYMVENVKNKIKTCYVLLLEKNWIKVYFINVSVLFKIPSLTTFLKNFYHT